MLTCSKCYQFIEAEHSFNFCQDETDQPSLVDLDCLIELINSLIDDSPLYDAAQYKSSDESVDYVIHFLDGLYHLDVLYLHQGPYDGVEQEPLAEFADLEQIIKELFRQDDFRSGSSGHWEPCC